MFDENKQMFDIMGILGYHKAGYLGQGINIAAMDVDFKQDKRYGENVTHVISNSSNLSSHGSSTVSVLNQIAPQSNIYFIGTKGSSGFDWILENDIHILNLSVLYGFKTETVAKYLRKIRNKGTIIICSAGNDREMEKLRYPGKSQNAVAVGAVYINPFTEQMELASYSSYTKGEQEQIKNQVEVCGFTNLRVVDLAEKEQQRNYGGTSCASPCVAAATALAMQKYGFSGVSKFREWKKENTIPIQDQGGYSLRKGYGLLTLPSTEINMWVDSKEYTVNGEKKEMDTAPLIQDDRVMVPIRFVSEALGYRVNWDGEERKVTITK